MKKQLKFTNSSNKRLPKSPQFTIVQWRGKRAWGRIDKRQFSPTLSTIRSAPTQNVSVVPLIRTTFPSLTTHTHIPPPTHNMAARRKSINQRTLRHHVTLTHTRTLSERSPCADTLRGNLKTDDIPIYLHTPYKLGWEEGIKLLHLIDNHYCEQQLLLLDTILYFASWQNVPQIHECHTLEHSRLPNLTHTLSKLRTGQKCPHSDYKEYVCNVHNGCGFSSLQRQKRKIQRHARLDHLQTYKSPFLKHRINRSTVERCWPFLSHLYCSKATHIQPSYTCRLHTYVVSYRRLLVL